jgi:hypothetical protein
MKSGLKHIDSLFPADPFPAYEPINLFGKYLSGKTVFTLQTAWWIVSQKGGAILYIDLDGGGDLLIQAWKPVFDARFNCDPEQVKIYYESAVVTKEYPRGNVKNIYLELPLFRLFGIEARVQTSRGGKATYVPEEVCKAKILDYKDVRVLIIDTWSELTKRCFVGMQSFEGRARATSQLYGELRNYALKRKESNDEVYIFVLHHASVHPQTGKISIAGGSEVLHNSKFAYMLEKIPAYGGKYGRFWVFRYPTIPEFGKFAYYGYCDMGMVDISEQELEFLKEKELKKKERKEEEIEEQQE